MEIAQFSYSYKNGGAGKACYRLHRSLLKCGQLSRIYTVEMANNLQEVSAPSSVRERLASKALSKLDRVPCQISIKSSIPRSPALFGYYNAKFCNALNEDLVHLHWICGGTISIEEIGKIKKPLIMTLHDMWAFCGSEHTTTNNRYVDGYIENVDGWDIDRWAYKRKLKNWIKPFQIVTPSNWLKDCVKSSKLMKNWDVEVIPNPLDIDKFKPNNKDICRKKYGLPLGKRIILFGAVGGDRDPNKGFHYLNEIIRYYTQSTLGSDTLFIVFGQLEPPNFEFKGKVIFLGYIYDEQELVEIYNSSDVVVIPSKIENLPQIGVEAQACGLPVVSFDVGGLRDIVAHRQTGFLASPYKVDELIEGIEWASNKIINPNIDVMKIRIRSEVELKWSERSVAERYLETYRKVIADYCP